MNLWYFSDDDLRVWEQSKVRPGDMRCLKADFECHFSDHAMSVVPRVVYICSEVKR